MRVNRLRTVKICALAIALPLVAGCENPYLMQFRDEFGWTESRMLQDGWLRSRAITVQPVYCYHTLADADCFANARPDQKDRRIGADYNGVF